MLRLPLRLLRQESRAVSQLQQMLPHQSGLTLLSERTQLLVLKGWLGCAAWPRAHRPQQRQVNTILTVLTSTLSVLIAQKHACLLRCFARCMHVDAYEQINFVNILCGTGINISASCNSPTISWHSLTPRVLLSRTAETVKQEATSSLLQVRPVHAACGAACLQASLTDVIGSTS